MSSWFVLGEYLKEWEKEIATRDKGIQFREGFNDSLLVFVYGKVKSGKSSLGNYMAWGHTDPTSELKIYTEKALHPKYFSHAKTSVESGDAEKEAEQKKEFRVGATEATSSIQGFRLAGLTWVDSPGLHSINQENGDLAKDYAKHADLILYTMTSDAPGRASDIKEIEALISNDKTLLVLLTGSDTTDFDDDANTIIVMKDEEDRAKQRNYVRKEIENLPELKGNKIEILSFSARYAQENQNHPQNFLNSGMGQFFSKLAQTAENEGIKLKQQVPMRNFKNFLKTFEGDLKKYLEIIASFNQPIERMKKNIPIQINEKTRSIQLELSQELDTEFLNLQSYRNDTAQMQKNIDTALIDLNQRYEKLLINAQRDILTQLVSDFDSNMLSVIEYNAAFKSQQFNIEQREEDVIDSITKGTRTRNGGFGTLGGGGLGAIIGTFIFPVVGTGIGAGIGSLLGGFLGSKTGDEAKMNTRKVSINVGDNLMQIQQKISQQIQDATQKCMNEFRKKILDTAVGNAELLESQLQSEIGSFQKEIKQMMTKIDASLI